MVTDHRGPGEEDQLAGFHGLRIFPKTFNVTSDASNPNDFDHQLQSIHDHLKSMVFKNPDKLTEQAKMILDGNSKMENSAIKRDQRPVVNNEFLPMVTEVNHSEQRQALDHKEACLSSNPTSSKDSKDPETFFEACEQRESVISGPSLKGKDSKDPEAFFEACEQREILPTMEEVNRRERRPCLGRKRARFSMISSSSQPVIISEPTWNPKDLRDPEAFFKAYEQHEIAKKEIRRLKGEVLTDSVHQNSSLQKRPRRPVMQPNKRPAKYRHLYPLDEPKAIDHDLPVPENFNSSIPSTDHHDSPESAHESPLTGLAGSLSDGEHEVSEILEELLSVNCEDLDDERVQNVLQERLKIKPIKLDKLNLPDFSDIPKIDWKSARSRNFSKPSHTLADMDNLLKGLGLSLKTPMKDSQGSGSSAHIAASPTPLKSPFSPLTLLSQRILRSSSSKDPFSADGIFGDPASNLSPQPINKEVSGAGIPFDIVSPETDDSVEVEKNLDVGTSVSHLPMADNTIDEITDNVAMNDKLAEHDADESAQANEKAVQEEMEEVLQETVAPHTSPPNTMESSLDDGSEEQDEVEDAFHEPVAPMQTPNNTEEPALDNSSTDHAEESVVSLQKSLNTMEPVLDNGSEEHTEMNEERPNIPLDKKHKAASISKKPRRRAELDRRKSLLSVAGTTCESGVRRSTRIKSRPLEFWNGERFLYGRVHKSLPTVIGLKYASPIAKGHKTKILKVKSFVSDEHKNLVDLVAR